MTSLLKLDSSPTVKKCKGLYWRGSTTANFDYHSGNMVVTKRLKFLKRKSCPGCDACDWIFDFLAEDVANGRHDYSEQALDKIEHGKVYTYTVHSSTEWGSGITEVEEVEFIEVKDV